MHIEMSCANDGEHSEKNSANYLFDKFLSASAWSS